MADTAVTISPTRVSQLSEQEAAATGFTSRYRVLYSDVAFGSGNADTVTVTLGATPASWYVDHAQVNVSTAFAGTTAFTLTVGTTSSVAAVVASTSVLTAAQIPQAVGVPVLTNTTATATKNLVAIFTNATGGSPSALTAGQLDIYLRVVDTSRLP